MHSTPLPLPLPHEIKRTLHVQLSLLEQKSENEFKHLHDAFGVVGDYGILCALHGGYRVTEIDGATDGTSLAVCFTFHQKDDRFPRKQLFSSATGSVREITTQMITFFKVRPRVYARRHNNFKLTSDKKKRKV